MNIIFVGLGDLYLPAVAAALRLGRLEGKKLPTQRELASLCLFRHGTKEDEGRLLFAGKDSGGNNIYLLCVNRHPDVVVRAMQSLAGIYSLSLHEVLVVPCLPENLQLSTWSHLLGLLGLQHLRNWLGYKLARNNFQRITIICKTTRDQAI